MEYLGTRAQESSTKLSLCASVSLGVKYRRFRGPFHFQQESCVAPQSKAPLGFHSSQGSPEFHSFPACLTSSCPNTISSRKPPVSPRAWDGSCCQC